MRIKTDRIYVLITVPKRIVMQHEGVFFYEKGIEMEDQVKENEVTNGVNATFEGFEVLSDFEQRELLQEVPEVDSISAKLYYYVDYEVK
ncbi:hypothetical protein [Sphingobacterium deserti]|uniref:Uncharacterized protein n=1 Tax=Sphingobacterium deserti TaxID=1229276 RepID=A0A0B8SYR6_9SPHI|nr:hypothetical protein [Sphingobacterium deserti]KGE12291.1 hypothetical protein DI53_3941 [Sphingobacterium deserti]